MEFSSPELLMSCGRKAMATARRCKRRHEIKQMLLRVQVSAIQFALRERRFVKINFPAWRTLALC
jgi:mitochondrial fission protein ELM1